MVDKIQPYNVDVILFIHLLKLRLHQFLFLIHIFHNPICRIDSGSEIIQNSIILIVRIVRLNLFNHFVIFIPCQCL